MQPAKAAAMDRVFVEAPATASRTAPIVRAFESDFQAVLDYAARLTDRIDDAPGIVCAAFRQVAERQPAAASGNLRAEVLKVATRLSHSLIRPRRWFSFRPRPHFDLILEGFPDAEARRALRRDTLQRALMALPFEDRAVILLRDYLKLSYEEISQITGIVPRKLVHALDRSRADLSEIYDYIKF